LEVTAAAGPVVIRAKRPRALLGILLLNAGNVVSVERIIDGIWPGQPPRSAVENVRTYAWQLRQLFGAAERAGGRLQRQLAGYRLVTDPEELDLLRFDSLAAGGSRALQVGDYASAAVLLGEALELWRGGPLSDLVLGPAVRAKIVALEERHRQLQVDWIRARLALGQHTDVVPLLRELIGERPYDESLHCLLMTALHAMGRTGEALAAFAEARHTLIDELGVDPGSELRRAQAAILSGNTFTVSVGAVGGAVPQYSAIPHELPATGCDLVGRDAELTEVTALVQEQESRMARRATVVVMSGPPGVGKTAAAVAVAARVSGAYPHGQLHVDLGGSTPHPLSTEEAVTRLLSGFGVDLEATAARGERSLSLYRSLLVDRRMLVVLDDAADAAQALPLIPGLGPSLVIVTSRRYLANLACDVRLKLEPLGEDDAVALLRSILGPCRVDEEPAAATAIVRACGGLPSAIAIAGARLAALPDRPLQFMADRLAVRDGVLDELSLDGLSMTELFETSYGSLDAQTQRCFRALGMFDPDHITAKDLAEPLQLSEPSADRQLERLVHEGLLRPARAEGGGPQYCMPSVLHEYARTRLSVEGTGPHALPTAEPALENA
jgi:DNA-binding SARP family transcriptional activator